MTDGPVVVFDSGLGGLSVVRGIRRLLPRLPLVYVADDAAFPYGDWDGAALTEHIVGVAGRIIREYRPRAFVVACNTASTLVLGPLRAGHDVPFVGTVPAIKPAAEQTRSGLISVLATPGTIARDYTLDLIDTFAAECQVHLVGSPVLAAMAEDHVLGRGVDRRALSDEIAPCFQQYDGRRTDIVVLACTHFPFLIELFTEAAPWPVRWLDPAPAIGRRLEQLVSVNAIGDKAAERVVLTSGRPVDRPTAALFAMFDFSCSGEIT